jgi:predicted nuclease with RNAse H fold
MHYCGVVAVRNALQLVLLEEVRADEPPIRLNALFYEPGSAAQVAQELHALGEVVIGVGAPLAGPSAGRPGRDCDALLLRRGVAPQAPTQETRVLSDLLRDLPTFAPGGEDRTGPVQDGSYRRFPVIETNADGVFCALQGKRVAAKRHPYGVWMRVEELAGDHILDDGGDLWHRRIEELDAAVCALCAHRYAVGHASWLGDPTEGVVVLPGASIPSEFERRGVMPPVERLHLSRA